MHVSRDFSHYVRTAGEGVQHIDLAVEGVTAPAAWPRSSAGYPRFPTSRWRA